MVLTADPISCFSDYQAKLNWYVMSWAQLACRRLQAPVIHRRTAGLSVLPISGARSRVNKSFKGRCRDPEVTQYCTGIANLNCKWHDFIKTTFLSRLFTVTLQYNSSIITSHVCGSYVYTICPFAEEVCQADLPRDHVWTNFSYSVPERHPSATGTVEE